MASRRALISSARCVHCRRQVLASFISSFDVAALSRSPRSSGFPKPIIPTIHSRRLYSTESPKEIQRDAAVDAAVGSSHTANTDEGKKPWYLQYPDPPELPLVEEPVVTSLVERQRLPDLPEDPPPILQDVLKHLSIDIGLDYLSVIDMRKMDPPAALGGNLIMIIGTARSERHLNVSADRFCRWLRSEYKLTPFADGLLGRNELKLKMKRKAKRSRMLGAFGARDSADYDDGTHTGWVCVNVGTVENGPIATAAQKQQDNSFVGFGTASNGAKIVVQMMTEERRGELDLESLWQGILRRAIRRMEREQQDESDTVEDETLDFRSAGRASPAAAMRQTMLRSLTKGPQARTFHTSTRHEKKTGFQMKKRDTSATKANKKTALIRDQPVERADLASLVNYLKSLPTYTAIEALGQGETDTSSTPFLQSFFNSFPTYAREEHWRALIDLHSHALKIEHPLYTKLGLIEVMRDMQANAVVASRGTYMQILETILEAPHTFQRARLEQGRNLEYDEVVALRRSIGWAAEIMEHMEAYGYDVATSDIHFSIHRALANPKFRFERAPEQTRPARETRAKAGTNALSNDTLFEPESSSLDSTSETQGFFSGKADPPITMNQSDKEYYQYRHLKAITLLLPNPSNELIIEIMRTHAHQQSWSYLWDAWRLIPQLYRSHTPAMYEIMFLALAESKDPIHCMQNLRDLLELMPKEDPPVELSGDVAVAAARCLAVARPDLQDRAWADAHEEISNALREALKEREGLAFEDETEVARKVESEHEHDTESELQYEPVMAGGRNPHS